MLQNAKYLHLPSPIPFNSSLPQPKASGKTGGRAELLLDRQHLHHAFSPAESFLQPSNHWDPCLSKDWSKMRSPTCSTQSRNAAWNEQEIWEWQAQVPAMTSIVWPSLSQNKRSLNKKALAGCPQLGPSWSEWDPSLSPGWCLQEGQLASTATPRAPEAPANSQELQEVIPPTPPQYMLSSAYT